MSIDPSSEVPTSSNTSIRAKLESLEDVRRGLTREHDELKRSLARLVDFVKGCDQTPARDEWEVLEPAVLRHLDVEEMLLLPAFERADASEARGLRAEHAEIRQLLGAVGVAFDLHLVRLEEIERLGELLTKHFARETGSMYAWAGADSNHFLARSMLRRLGKPVPADPDETVVSILVRLLDACRDGEHGYRHAAECVRDEGYRLVFQRHSGERSLFADALGRLLQQFGVSPEQRGTLLGAMHHRWLDASATLTQGSPQTVLRECARGEEAATTLYADALRAGLPPDIREIVQEQRDALWKALDEIHSLMAKAENPSTR